MAHFNQSSRFDTLITSPSGRSRGGARKPRSGTYVKSGIHVSGKRDRQPMMKPASDHEEKPIRIPASITLARTTVSEITDADVGMPDDPHVQADAESHIPMTLAYRAHQADREALATRKANRAPIIVRLAEPADMVEPRERVVTVADKLDRLAVSPDRSLEGLTF